MPDALRDSGIALAVGESHLPASSANVLDGTLVPHHLMFSLTEPQMEPQSTSVSNPVVGFAFACPDPNFWQSSPFLTLGEDTVFVNWTPLQTCAHSGHAVADFVLSDFLTVDCN